MLVLAIVPLLCAPLFGVFGLNVWSLCLSVVLFVLFLAFRLRFIGDNEQLFVLNLTTRQVFNGPRVMFLPLLARSAKKAKATSLGPLDYVVITDTMSGENRVEQGPKLLFLGPYDRLTSQAKVLSLKATQFVRFMDESTGEVRVEVGEQGRVVPGPNEVLLDRQGVRQAIDLKCFEYVKIEDKKTGRLRVERGEQLVFLSSFEEVVGSKGQAVNVDENTAVLVRNRRTGQLNLIVDKELFIPSADEEIMEVRQLIKLADYEACIVRGKKGEDRFFFGSKETQRSFFLPPHSELVQMRWSQGRRREKRSLCISKIDLRPMYMSFEFNCRTADNVELVLEGSFFWEIKDLQAMVQFTNDTTGDICNHARSGFIERVSKVTLQQFMNGFNAIAEQVHKDDRSTFYDQRGVQIHSLEVTGYRCAERSTAATLGEIIKETTNRMNRLQQQESENEVQLACIKGDIEEELARSELLKVQTANKRAVAEMEGLGEAQKVRSFLSHLKDDVPDFAQRMQAWQVLRKQDALRELAQGTASTKLYFTPADVNLSIENHEHDGVMAM